MKNTPHLFLDIYKNIFVFYLVCFFKRPKRTTYFLNCKCPCFRSAGPCSPRRTWERETHREKKKKKKISNEKCHRYFRLFSDKRFFVFVSFFWRGHFDSWIRSRDRNKASEKLTGRRARRRPRSICKCRRWGKTSRSGTAGRSAATATTTTTT